MPGKLIVLEGIDGAGKTTLAANAAGATYEEWVSSPDEMDGRLVFVSRRQISATSSFAAGLMEKVAHALWSGGDATDLRPHFWVTLQASWFAAHSQCVVGPVLESGADVIVDGWVYKFWSKLLAQGYTEETLQLIFQDVREPDHVILLDVDIEDVYDRGRSFRPTELGMHAGYSELNRETFVDYQSKGMSLLRQFAQDGGWSTLEINPGELVEVTTGRLRSVVTRLTAFIASESLVIAG